MGRLAAATLIALLVPAAVAAAAPVRVEDPLVRTCAARLVSPGTAGAARATYAIAREGLLTVRLRAAAGDWDLALFDADGRPLGASASFGAREVVTVAAHSGRTVIAQACRRTGGAREASVGFDLYPTALGRRGEPAQMVRVRLAAPGDHERLEALGLDVTHAHGPGHADVVVYTAEERRTLTAHGFAYEVRIPDMRAADARQFAADRAYARRVGRAAVPSGRTAYRTLQEYQDDLKAIVAQHPGLARAVTVGRSLEDRPIEGVELAADVARTDDGRPTYVVMGLHHAREWPSGEMPMEFAVDLANGYAGDPRIRSLLDSVRVLILPVVNPDGFAVSRAAGEAPDDDLPGGGSADAAADRAAYKRKNCRASNPAAAAIPCASRSFEGVDLNRNYGAYWGGTGAGTSASASNYRGTAPYSEPESEAIHKLSQTRNLVTVITHHTYTDEGVWLRQPGFCPFGADGCSETEDIVPDEAGMKALGDAMGVATGWRSALGWDIGEITGATEDWNYFATGAYGYTPEQRGPNFHPAYATAVVAEYDGSAAGAAGGVREALLRAGEHTRDRAYHAVVRGTAPPGRVLRLYKAFATATSQDDLVVNDVVDLTLTVPASGAFTWDVNQSTRPLATVPEAYALTCETPGGQVLERRDVVVARGQTVDLALACTGAGAGGGPGGSGPGGGGAGGGGGPGTTPARGPRLTISRSTFSARAFNRSRRLRITVRVADGPVTAVSARLLNRGGRVFAQARRTTLNGRARLTLKRRRVLRPGRYELLVSARFARGTVRATRAVRARR